LRPTPQFSGAAPATPCHGPLQLLACRCARDAIHTTRAGRRLLVLHGHEFDAVVRGQSLGVLLGGFACRTLLQLNLARNASNSYCCSGSDACNIRST
jgi:hypothetical protein